MRARVSKRGDSCNPSIPVSEQPREKGGRNPQGKDEGSGAEGENSSTPPPIKSPKPHRAPSDRPEPQPRIKLPLQPERSWHH